MTTNAEIAVRAALDILERASDSWRNGNPSTHGPLRWPVAVHFARAELRKALEALADSREAPSPALRGSAAFTDTVSY